jgi:hypothetical protein
LPDFAAGLAAAFAFQAAPEERVVPHLRGIVEHLRARRFACRREDDLFERRRFVGRALDQFVQLVDIALVMLAMVEALRVRGDDRLQRAFGIRERRKREHRNPLRRDRVGIDRLRCARGELEPAPMPRTGSRQ